MMADGYITRYGAIGIIMFGENREEMVQKIKELPEENVAPVVHGKWENQSPVFCWNKYGVYQTAYKCSVCGEMTPIDYNICPWCGARMDGET
jgi:rubrerythrin